MDDENVLHGSIMKSDFDFHNQYLSKLKKLVLSSLSGEEVKVVVFGSRARKDYHSRSDVDIGLIPYGKLNKKKLTQLKEKIEDLNIPYKVEIVDFSQTSESFREEALKEVLVWRD